MADSSGRVASRRGRRFLPAWLTRVLLLLLVALVVLLAYQATRTGLALHRARSDAATLRAELAHRDQAGATRTARDLARQARVAHSHSDNLLWDGLAAVPFVGDNVDAVQRLSVALDHVGGVVGDSLEVVSVLDEGSLRSDDGRVDLGVVAGLQEPLARLSAALGAADREAAPIRPEQLLPGLSGQVRSAVDQLHQVAVSARAGATAVRLLPTMLGGEGRRTYLLAVQNPAETRATGGIPGSLSLLDVEDGKVTLGAQRTVDSYRALTTPVTPVSAQEKAIYGDSLGYDLRDMTINPDFPTDARRLAALEQRDHGTRLDGVVSVDPIAFAALLDVTGPVTVQGDRLDGGNAVRLLLNETYVRFRSDDRQNAFFAAAARGIFDGLVQGDLSADVVGSISRSVGERRIMVWSSHPDEQRRLGGTAIAGRLPSGASAHPQVGLYLNDGTTGKLEYYLDHRATLASTGCTDGRAQRLHADMVLTSSVPQDAASLSPFITGLGGFAPPGVMRLYLQVYAPAGGRLTALEANGKRVELPVRDLDGRGVTTVTILLEPGEQVRLGMDFLGARGADEDAVLQWTPGMRRGPTRATAPTACG